MKVPYIDCGDGWLKLIDPLIEECNKRGVHIAQIKEKFGTLRFYIHGGDEELYNLIDKAEMESAHICEVCGDPGEFTSYGWIKTLCPLHAKEREAHWKARQERMKPQL